MLEIFWAGYASFICLGFVAGSWDPEWPQKPATDRAGQGSGKGTESPMTEEPSLKPEEDRAYKGVEIEGKAK